MNEVQINKIKKRADEYATSCFPYEKQFLEREAVVKCCVHVVTETIAELEKENAELKEKLEMGIALKDEEIGCIQTDFNTFKSKAKELLNKWLFFHSGPKGYPSPLQSETEQFLNSEVEK